MNPNEEVETLLRIISVMVGIQTAFIMAAFIIGLILLKTA